jgi:hypothetical protein
MPLIPLGVSAYERKDGLIPETELVNLFIEQSEPANQGEDPVLLRLQRPGLTRFATMPYDYAIQGMFRQDGLFGGKIFVTSAGRLWSVTGAAVTDLGDVRETGLKTSFAANNFHLAMVTAGGLFLYNGSNIIQVSIPTGRIPVDVTDINSYFVVACSDGRYYWLEPGATSIDALNFATAESSPDGLVGVKRIKDEVFFFGPSTIEVWQPTGDQDAILRNAGGRQFDRGCLDRDTICRFDNSMLWVGEDGIVYRVDNVPKRVSNYGIEERIKARAGSLSAWSFPYKGHLFYVLKIPGQGSYVYDASTESWSQFASEGNDTWRPATGVSFNGVTYCGDELGTAGGRIWTLDDSNFTDDGTKIVRRISGTIQFDGRPVRNGHFSMSVGCDTDTLFNLRWKDGREPYPDTYEQMYARSPVDVVTLFRLGRMNQPFHTFEIMVDTNSKIRITGAKINEAWGGTRR